MGAPNSDVGFMSQAFAMRALWSRAAICAACSIALWALAACTLTPSKITYEQVGACNANDVGARDHLAFVFFRIQDIDNSQTNATYTFHPTHLWINTGDLYSGYDFVATGQEASVLGPDTHRCADINFPR